MAIPFTYKPNSTAAKPGSTPQALGTIPFKYVPGAVVPPKTPTVAPTSVGPRVVTPGNPTGSPSGLGSFATAGKNLAAIPVGVRDLAQGSAKGAIRGIDQGLSGLTSLGGGVESALDQTLGRGANVLAGKGNVPTKTGQSAQVAAAQLNAAANIPALTYKDNSEKVGGVIGQIADLLVTPPGGKAAKVGTAGSVDTFRTIGDLNKTRHVIDAIGADSTSLKNSIQDVMPLQSKSVRIDELRNTLPDSAAGKGGVTREGILGKSTPQPTAEDVARGTAAHDYIAGTKDPVQKIANVNQGIKDTSRGVDEFLDSKSAPANFSDMRTYLEANHPPTNLQKDPGALEAYSRATEDALNTLYNTMKKSATATGDFGAQTSGKDIRQARIAIDQQITKELGENTFGTPQYKGIKAAEISTRNMLNRLSEDMLRYPGQLDKVNNMNEFVNTARGRGVDVNLNDKSVLEQIEKSFGLNATKEGEANAQKLAAQHEFMSQLYDARDNLIDRYQSSLGKNRVQETIAGSPVLKALSGSIKRVLPYGIGSHL